MKQFKCKCGCIIIFETDDKLPKEKVCFMCGEVIKINKEDKDN